MCNWVFAYSIIINDRNQPYVKEKSGDMLLPQIDTHMRWISIREGWTNSSDNFLVTPLKVMRVSNFKSVKHLVTYLGMKLVCCVDCTVSVPHEF